MNDLKLDGVEMKGSVPNGDPQLLITPGWTLREPNVPFNGRTICIPTVHPYGDQRILKCVQSLLDVGYKIKIIWLGGTPGDTFWGERLHEVRLPAAASRLDRMKAIRRIARIAASERFSGWHIHDFYMLPVALWWSRRTDRPVIYDVHEYYGELYSAMLPAIMRKPSGRIISSFEKWAASRLGGANVAARDMAPPFTVAGVPVAITPNYPPRELYAPFSRELTSALMSKILHSGTLTESYGSKFLIDVACHLRDCGSDLIIDAVARFPSRDARNGFLKYFAMNGSPRNVRLIPAVPSSELPEMLGRYGVGLSMLQDCGQNRLAVATKLYEYTIVGLVVVATDLPAQRAFLSQSAARVLINPRDPRAFADALINLSNTGNYQILQQAAHKSRIARKDLTWEDSSAPHLQALALDLI